MSQENNASVPKSSERKLQLMLAILNHTNKTTSNSEEFSIVLSLLRDYLQCDAVAIRMLKNSDYPYVTSVGFVDEFILEETSLLVKDLELSSDETIKEHPCTLCNSSKSPECLCGAVVSGSLPQSLKKTKTGTFYTGDINKDDKDGKLSEIPKVRNICGKSGYSSVLLIPLRQDDKTIGLLQCNDSQKNFFSDDDIALLENVGSSIALAIANNEEYLYLKRKSDLFTQAQSVAKIGSWVINRATGVMEFLEGLSEIHQYDFISNETLLSDFVKERVIAEDHYLIFDVVKNAKENERHSVDFRARMEDGEVHYFRAVGFLVGEKLQGITFDITEHQNTKIEAEESRAFMESIVSGMNTSIVVIDPQINRIVDVNQSALDILKMSRTDVMKIRGTSFMSVRYFKKPRTLGLINENMKSNEEAMLKRGDQSLVPVQRVVMRPKIHGKTHYVILMFDISESKQMEQSLAHAQKMESIGSLAAGVAHEINTPIQYIGDNTFFLQESFAVFKEIIEKYNELIEVISNGSDYTAMVSEIMERRESGDVDFLLDEIPEAITQTIDGISRVSTIVQAMKKFSHPGKTEMTLNDLNEIVSNTTIVARNEWKYVADLKLNLSESLPQVAIHADDISQVILNLIVNASHAIGDVVSDGEKGEIEITSEFDEKYVTLKIRDTGGGIPEEIHDKIFNPFFTTKEVGKGTGQGLAMAYSIITEKHKGTLDFTSKMGDGTTFIIRIPRG